MIPDRVLANVAIIESGDGLRRDGGVECVTVLGHDALIADGYCEMHDDLHIPHQYSLLLIVRNDVNSYVLSSRVKPCKEQPVGTAILIDIWHKHKLEAATKDKPCGVWCALCIDLEKELPVAECDDLWKEALRRLR